MINKPTIKVYNFVTKQEQEWGFMEFVKFYENLREQERRVFNNRAKVSNVVEFVNCTYTFDPICYTSFRRSYNIAVA